LNRTPAGTGARGRRRLRIGSHASRWSAADPREGSSLSIVSGGIAVPGFDSARFHEKSPLCRLG
jgi:hypothetical protein